MAVLAIAALGSVAGGAIGYGVGHLAIGASIGWAIGAYVGSALLSTSGDAQNVGPRLEDLTVQTSAYGAPIPDVFGSQRIAGNLIWSSGLIETITVTEEEIEGGKGGGGSSTVRNTIYTYSASFAIGLCEGTIQGIGRIWFDNKPYADFRSGASQQNQDSVTIYFGSESQNADSTIQAYEGAANTPAYRGLAYIVFEDVALADYGNHHPNVTVEVFRAATVYDFTRFAAVAGTDLVGNDSAAYSSDGITWTSSSGTTDEEWFGVCWSPELSLFCAVANSGSGVMTSTDGSTWTSQTNPGVAQDWVAVCWSPTLRLFCTVASLGAGDRVMTSPDGVTWTLRTPASVSSWRGVCWGQGKFVAVGASVIMTSTDGITWTSRTNPVSQTWKDICYNPDSTTGTFCAVGFAGRSMVSNDGINWSDYLISSGNSYNGVCWSPSLNLYCAVGAQSGGDSIVTSPDGQTWTARTDPSVIDWEAIDWSEDDSLFVAVGTSGAITSSDGITWTDRSAGMPNQEWKSIAFGSYTGYTYHSENHTTYSDIITEVCADAGLGSGLIDVSGLTGTLIGYTRTNVMTARNAIDPLLLADLIDVAEIDKKLVFTKRGGSSVETITTDDLAATSSNKQPDDLIETKANESELPSKIIVKFFHVGRDYEIDSQYSEFYFPSINNVQVIDVPIPMSSNAGLQMANKLLKAAWEARTRYNFSTTTKYIELTPCDVVTVNSIRMRITDMSIGGNVINYSAASEFDASLFSSDLETDESDYTEELPFEPETSFSKFLDCPAFNEFGNDSGFYFGAYGLDSDWRGAILYYSSDAGSSFNKIQTVVSAATVGFATDVLGDSPNDCYTWDNKSSVTIQLLTPNKTLSSSTEEAVLNGANSALIGVSGRWEIIQFIDVVDNGSSNYTLSNFLRGRRGTEWTTGDHAINDEFILINSALTRISLGSNNIGLERTYRIDSIGSLTQNPSTETFILRAVSLNCYAVDHVEGTRDGSNNLTITWKRRDRIDGEWRDSIDIGLSEASESYEIDIMNGAAVVRTLTATSETVDYTAAQQTTDFGSAQSSVDVKIYQMSAVVGRGIVKEATV